MTRGARIGCLVGILPLFLLISFAAAFIGAEWIPQALIIFFFGWIHHGWVTAPKVTVNWSGVGMLIACLGLIAGMGHRFCAWLWQGTGHADPWRPR